MDIKQELEEKIAEINQKEFDKTGEYGIGLQVINDLITALLPLFKKYAPSLCEVDEGKMLEIINGHKCWINSWMGEDLMKDKKDLAHTLATSNLIKLKGE